MKFAACLIAIMLLGSCHRQVNHEDGTEVVAIRPIDFRLSVSGTLTSSDIVTINTPGRPGSPHLIDWIVADGATVKKGDVIAQFSTEQSIHDKSLASINTEKADLSRIDHVDDLKHKESVRAIDIKQVDGQLAIAHRYAGARIGAIARNDVLDAVQDEGFLKLKRSILKWQDVQQGNQAHSELAALDAQRNVFQASLERSIQDLSSMEARASIDGPIILQRDWTGATPNPGATLYGGNPLATQPKTSDMEITFYARLADSYDLRIGDPVYVTAVGLTRRPVVARISWVADSAQAISVDDPEKFLAFRVLITASEASAEGWVIGQDLTGDVHMRESKVAISVPNIAIADVNGNSVVVVVDAQGEHQQKVSVGRRGPARTEILGGLAPGQRIKILSDRGGAE